MTKPRSILLSISALTMLTLMLSFAVYLFADIGIAHAQGAAPPVTPAASDPDFLSLVIQSQWLPAVGVALIAIVGGLRAGLGTIIPWLTTKAGGYALGYGSALLLYVGGALKTGHPIDVSLLSTALVAAWSAAGGWEHFRDAVLALRGSPAATKATAVVAGILVSTIGMSLALSGCGAAQKIKAAVIDCIGANRDQVGALESDMWNKLTAGGTWEAAEDQAKHAGIVIGGCALVELVTAPPSQLPVATPVASAVAAAPRVVTRDSAAKAALENFRSTVAGGAIFRTTSGDQ